MSSRGEVSARHASHVIHELMGYSPPSEPAGGSSGDLGELAAVGMVVLLSRGALDPGLRKPDRSAGALRRELSEAVSRFGNLVGKDCPASWAECRDVRMLDRRDAEPIGLALRLGCEIRHSDGGGDCRVSEVIEVPLPDAPTTAERLDALFAGGALSVSEVFTRGRPLTWTEAGPVPSFPPKRCSGSMERARGPDAAAVATLVAAVEREARKDPLPLSVRILPRDEAFARIGSGWDRDLDAQATTLVATRVGTPRPGSSGFTWRQVGVLAVGDLGPHFELDPTPGMQPEQAWMVFINLLVSRVVDYTPSWKRLTGDRPPALDAREEMHRSASGPWVGWP
jgi:hypothetical protein